MPDEYNGDVVVVAASTDNDSGYAGTLSSGGYSWNHTTEDEVTPWSEEAGGGDRTFVDALIEMVTDVISQVVGKQFKTAEQMRENENRIGNQFDPNKVVATAQYTTDSGKTGKIWAMQDGTNYWDMNGNDKPDYYTMFTQSGTLYGNDGSGWVQLN